jgi:flagellar biosynthesis protein FlhG
MLLEELYRIESGYDVILVDTGAGVASSVLDFVVAADFVLVITTAEATAITDAYALIKLSLQRNPDCSIGLVANRVRSAREGESALQRIADCTERFLGLSVLDLGCVWEDGHVRAAVNERVPFVHGYPKSRASVSMRRLARYLRQNDIVSSRGVRAEDKVSSRLPGSADGFAYVAACGMIGSGVNKAGGE